VPPEERVGYSETGSLRTRLHPISSTGQLGLGDRIRAAIPIPDDLGQLALVQTLPALEYSLIAWMPFRPL
jgi:hypothetical protein